MGGRGGQSAGEAECTPPNKNHANSKRRTGKKHGENSQSKRAGRSSVCVCVCATTTVLLPLPVCVRVRLVGGRGAYWRVGETQRPFPRLRAGAQCRLPGPCRIVERRCESESQLRLSAPACHTDGSLSVDAPVELLVSCGETRTDFPLPLCADSLASLRVRAPVQTRFFLLSYSHTHFFGHLQCPW